MLLAHAAAAQAQADRALDTGAATALVRERLGAAKSYEAVYEGSFDCGDYRSPVHEHILYRPDRFVILRSDGRWTWCGTPARVRKYLRQSPGMESYELLIDHDPARLASLPDLATPIRVAGMPFDPLDPLRSHPVRGAFAFLGRKSGALVFRRIWKAPPGTGRNPGQNVNELRELIACSEKDGFPVYWAHYMDGQKADWMTAKRHALNPAIADGQLECEAPGVETRDDTELKLKAPQH